MRNVIKLNIDDSTFYDDAIVLIKSFYPRIEIVTGELTDEDNLIEEISVSTPVFDGREKRILHDEFKTNLYNFLHEKTNINLPWGKLTGVRPSKIAVSMINEGYTEDAILKYFTEDNFVSDTKAKLALQVAKKELELLEKIDYKDGYSLYVGIPFCPTTCLYCSFTSYPLTVWEKKIDSYLDALFVELEEVSKMFADKKLNTIYFGGGTPTTLSATQLDRLLSKIEECFNLEDLIELTVEAGRPDSITKEKLMVLKEHKVDRISINPQTMNQETLDIIGRRHTVEDILESFKIARECGFDNINMDLIMGLPEEDEEKIYHTLEEVTKLKPESLTIHSLAIKRAAALNIWRDKYRTYAINNTEDIINHAAKVAASMDMEPYYMYRQKNMAGNLENVGYSVPGKECLYNILIMEEVQTIIACGAGTVTKRVYPDGRIERCDNVKDVALYISKIEEMIDRKRQLFAD